MVTDSHVFLVSRRHFSFSIPYSQFCESVSRSQLQFRRVALQLRWFKEREPCFTETITSLIPALPNNSILNSLSVLCAECFEQFQLHSSILWLHLNLCLNVLLCICLSLCVFIVHLHCFTWHICSRLKFHSSRFTFLSSLFCTARSLHMVHHHIVPFTHWRSPFTTHSGRSRKGKNTWHKTRRDQTGAVETGPRALKRHASHPLSYLTRARLVLRVPRVPSTTREDTQRDTPPRARFDTVHYILCSLHPGV